jgi:AcrR family transcriptional regulator
VREGHLAGPGQREKRQKEMLSRVTTAERVDPRVKRTRKLLQQAFLELLQEKAFASISIQDITQRATVNRATFYAHFPDKYALMDSILREQFQQAVASTLPPSPSWGVQSLHLLIEGVFGFLRDCSKPTDTQFDPLVERAVQQELAKILLGWLKQAKTKGVKPRVRLERAASVMSWAIFGTAVEWSRNERAPSAKEMATQVLLVLTEGVAHLTPDFLP